MSQETLYHVTVLSNFARAYNKYARTYDKQAIPESRFPDRFFLLKENELLIGIKKTSRLLQKTRLQGDRLIALCTTAPTDKLTPNTQTGLGRIWHQSSIAIHLLYEIVPTGLGHRFCIEEAYSASLAILKPKMKPFGELRPRSISVLPIALGCQASCPFCFSKGSVSSGQQQKQLDMDRVREILREGQHRGAERAVITGGGEPGLIGIERLSALTTHCRNVFSKVVLITNGYFLTAQNGETPEKGLDALSNAGLSVLSISRHHETSSKNAALMNLSMDAEEIARDWNQGKSSGRWPNLAMRWVCVLQQGGVDSVEAVERYLSWTVRLGVREVCFKELYVASSLESIYYDQAANRWSREHQVPLKIVLRFAQKWQWIRSDSLPWGAPIFTGEWEGVTIRVAAYKEPSVFWERTHGLARSWNIMADGTCLVSLEDRCSEILSKNPHALLEKTR